MEWTASKDGGLFYIGSFKFEIGWPMVRITPSMDFLS